jgi:hypothetical protein
MEGKKQCLLTMENGFLNATLDNCDMSTPWFAHEGICRAEKKTHI